MNHLILVKHAMPQIDMARDARDWLLSETSYESCVNLARDIARYVPTAIETSDEPKAIQTGEIVAAQLGMAYHVAPDLHEHDRRGVPFSSRTAFHENVARFFARPGEHVFGKESANEAHERFVEAVNAVIGRHAGETTAIVAHGTVITLYVARLLNIDPYPFWRSLGLPSMVVLSAEGELVETMRRY